MFWPPSEELAYVDFYNNYKHCLSLTSVSWNSYFFHSINLCVVVRSK